MFLRIVLKIKSYEQYIQAVRDDIGKSTDDWKFVNLIVFELYEWNLYKYSEFRQLEKNLNIFLSECGNTYVLLNQSKNEILQYFWMKESKIYSFHLFIQGDVF